MQGQTTQPVQPLSELWSQFVGFMPTLAAGLFIILLGLALGWLVKRTIVRLLVWLRLDRLAGRVGWRAAFGKGDVRSALYDMAGNVGMFLVVLIFLNDALNRWGFTALSRVIDAVVVYLPNIGIVAVIVGVGLLVSSNLETKITETLTEEGVVRARLIGKAVRGVLVTFVFALALWQLHFARELILAAFLISLGALGVAFALGVGLGTAKAVEHGISGLFRQHEDDD